MRIHLKIESGGIVVSFNHQRKLTGTVHKWMGKEDIEHGEVSTCSVSMVAVGKKLQNLMDLFLYRTNARPAIIESKPEKTQTQLPHPERVWNPFGN